MSLQWHTSQMKRRRYEYYPSTGRCIGPCIWILRGGFYEFGNSGLQGIERTDRIDVNYSLESIRGQARDWGKKIPSRTGTNSRLSVQRSSFHTLLVNRILTLQNRSRRAPSRIVQRHLPNPQS